MTTHFSTGTRRRRTPPWCKPGMFGHVPPFTNDKPTTMNAIASWTDQLGTDKFTLIDTLHLRRAPGFAGWLGRTDSQPYWLELEVRETSHPEHFLIYLYVKANWGTIASQLWFHHQPDPAGRWDTGILENIWTPFLNEVTLRLLA